jgi:hypothetical protein
VINLFLNHFSPSVGRLQVVAIDSSVTYIKSCLVNQSFARSELVPFRVMESKFSTTILRGEQKMIIGDLKGRVK